MIIELKNYVYKFVGNIEYTLESMDMFGPVFKFARVIHAPDYNEALNQFWLTIPENTRISNGRVQCGTETGYFTPN